MRDNGGVNTPAIDLDRFDVRILRCALRIYFEWCLGARKVDFDFVVERSVSYPLYEKVHFDKDKMDIRSDDVVHRNRINRVESEGTE